MADKYFLRVTAGPDYTHQTPVAVNTSRPTHIETSSATITLHVRIASFRSDPSHPSPATSPYFETPPHTHDRYSLAWTLTPKAGGGGIPGAHLVLGNDFDRPIREHLPPLFGQAFKAATWFVDPGLYGDVQAEKPYLYSPLLSGVNALSIRGKKKGGEGGEGGKEGKEGEEEEEEYVTEGAEDDGKEVRKELGLPDTGSARMKWFLNKDHLKKFTFEEGREYAMDFFNPYLDFNDFALKLPHFGPIPSITIPIISYWDGQPLRYVLKNRETDETLFVIVIALVPKDEQAKKEVESKPNAESTPVATSAGDDDVD